MHLASVLAALLLLLGGVSGLLNIFNPLGIVLSVYNIIFALLILVAELKALPVFKTVHKRVDVYFHLLSVPRGKAGFYVFVGVLAFFASQWSISRICILAVAVVGVRARAPRMGGGRKGDFPRICILAVAGVGVRARPGGHRIEGERRECWVASGGLSYLWSLLGRVRGQCPHRRCFIVEGFPDTRT